MYILGFNGGFDLAHERRFVLGQDATHDAAAVLLHDGTVVAAIEEERLTRIKHCSKFPIESIRFCCESAGICVSDVDHFAFFTEERFADYYLDLMYLNNPELDGPRSYRTFFVNMIKNATGVQVKPECLKFVKHHLAHAASAHAWAGMDNCLVAVFDGQGETNSGLVASASSNGLQVLETFPVRQSLGYMYLSTIRLLGYWNGEESKVMGLAPYGDPTRFRRVFQRCFSLLPDGRYEVDEAAMVAALLRFCPPRRRGHPFTKEHRDVAAGLQATLEAIVLHVLAHYRELTGLRKLALAGGVAHNCAMNGKILASRLFEEMVVHPASYDPGCAMGAAQLVFRQHAPASGICRARAPVFGGDARFDLDARLAEWSTFIEYEKKSDIVGDAANALAGGEIVGWVQGRSEFGPRALGARNILADARPTENRDRVNRSVKKRETYRPFAPAVTAEKAAEYFNLTSCSADHGYMSFAVEVLQHRRELLGAVTHVDGTARVQIVRAEENARFWGLIERFGQITGTPVLLSTSFNNDVEPIVETATDAIVCFLTTDIDALVIDDYVIRRKIIAPATYLTCIPVLPAHVTQNSSTASRLTPAADLKCFLATTVSYGFRYEISPEMHEFLLRCDGRRSIGELFALHIPQAAEQHILGELLELWSRRLLQLRPGA